MAEKKRILRIRRALEEDETAEPRNVALILPITILTLVVVPLFSEYTWGAVASVVLVGAGAIFALHRTGARTSVIRGALAVVVLSGLVAAGSTAVGRWLDSDTAKALVLGMFSLLLLLTPATVILRLLLRPRITLDTVAGALAAYMQVGIFFASIFRLADIFMPDGFFAQTQQPSPTVFQYFSFITLTTVGYGDYTPANSAGQLMATLEAVLGQLFLVTVVALVVGNLGREIPRRGTQVDDEAADA